MCTVRGLFASKNLPRLSEILDVENRQNLREVRVFERGGHEVDPPVWCLSTPMGRCRLRIKNRAD